MVTKQEILLMHYREGKSQREISREVGVSRKTVRKYLTEYEDARQRLAGEVGEEVSTIIESIVEAPKYKTENRVKRRLSSEISEKIESYIEANRIKRQNGLHKQQMKKIDIWEALCEGGYQISYSTVCTYIRSKQGANEAYIKQGYEPGSVCEFDWGEVKLVIDGVRRTYQMAVFTCAWNNYRYALLFARQDSQSFQQAHIRFFEHVGGVHKQLVYDNMRVAVRRFVGRTEKEATQALLSMSVYCQFGFRFCNVNSGHEKGHVERSIEYVRRKAFSGCDEFEGLARANAHLLEVCGGLNMKVQIGKEQHAAALLEEEKKYLAGLPAVAMECALRVPVRVDKYATVCCANNHYSVPDHLVGKVLEAKVYPEKIVVYQGRERMCEHERQYSVHSWHIKLEHYLETLRRKPGALPGSVAWRQADEQVRRLYERYFKGQNRMFIELLQYQKKQDVSMDGLEEVIHKILRMGCREITLDKIKVLCECQAPAPKISRGIIEEQAEKQLRQVAALVPSSDSFTTKPVRP